MMLHQDGSTHKGVAGQQWDLIVIMDDATNINIIPCFLFPRKHGVELPGRAGGHPESRVVQFALHRPGQELKDHTGGRRQGG
jgi:hypothetical protein